MRSSLNDRLTERGIAGRADTRRAERSEVQKAAFTLLWAACACIAMAALMMVAFSIQEPTRASWDGTRYTCPEGTDVWADESEARAGKDDYVYCVAAR